MVKNAFELREQKMIPAVLVYVEVGNKVLMIHRRDRDGDIHSGKWNGLGGKMELGESALQAARRELFEESGIDLPDDRFVARGCLHFPNFKAAKCEDWMVFLFTVKGDESLLLRKFSEIDEGVASWVDKTQINELNLWPGDRMFLPQIFAGKNLLGTLWYEDGKVSRFWLQQI